MALIFVGPRPGSPHIAHAGGQLTATIGFAEFAARKRLAIRWIDTAQSNFPVPAAPTRMLRAARRVTQFVRTAAAPGTSGAILFAGAGASFIERSMMALFARMFGIPVVVMIRSGHFRTQYHNSPVFRLIAKWLLRIPNRVGVQGESWMPLLDEAGVDRGRVVVVPNWLSHLPAAPRVRVRQPGNPLRLLFAGWMTPYKGVPELIEAARLLGSETSDFVLTMVGGGDLLEEAREAAGEPMLADRLAVTGWLEREALGSEMVRADILILPSHAEGFPNVVMEAMAEGMPIIATPVGAIPDSVSDGANGLIVPIGDSRAIADAVRVYLAEPETLERHSRAALATAAQRHGRDANCQTLLAAIAPSPDDSRKAKR